MKKNVGNHTQRDKAGELVTITSKGGEIIELDNDQGDLCKMFPGKFEEVKIPGTKSNQEDEEKPRPKKKVVRRKKKSVSLGRDGTSKFSIAEEQDFKVFYKAGKGWFVTEADDPFVALNKKPLKKDEVEEFIEEYLEEE
ncbi:MAG: hypothetical protein ACTSRU_21145 [Candidatus Hodarchaeales archaeon]